MRHNCPICYEVCEHAVWDCHSKNLSCEISITFVSILIIEAALQYLFDSLKDTRVLNCGHTIHMECYNEMLTHNKYVPHFFLCLTLVALFLTKLLNLFVSDISLDTPVQNALSQFATCRCTGEN